MVTNPMQFLGQIATFLKVPVGKITLNEEGLPTLVVNNVNLTGYVNIISHLLAQSQTGTKLNGSNPLEIVEIRQWIEYVAVYVLLCNTTPNINQVFKYLDQWLGSRTYIVSHRLTIADIILYHAIYNIVEEFSSQDKERFLNVSRWFDNVQQDKNLRRSNKIVDFKINYLLAGNVIKSHC